MKNIFKKPNKAERALMVAWWGEAWVSWAHDLPAPPPFGGLMVYPPLPEAPVPACFVEGPLSFARWLEAARYAELAPHCRDCNARDQAKIAAAGRCGQAGRVLWFSSRGDMPVEGWLPEESTVAWRKTEPAALAA